ncbi:MAG: molybdopterin-dependent oxidoreductase [Myxococcota bacterium]|nr:molybdopterin-dependent oxidoreductase [Myxococcota bacterium]
MPELDRRHFMKLVGVGAGAAATAACSDPVEKLVPYVVQPEVITPGIALEYASTCTECSTNCGLHVRTREGRPIKLDGNPEHPINRGALCARGQAAIARPYLPQRYEAPTKRNADGSTQKATWAEAEAAVVAKLRSAGGRTWVLGGQVGPSLSGVIDGWVSAVGGGRVVYEPFAYEALREAAAWVFGVRALPIFDLSETDLIVDFGSNFLEAGPSPVEGMRQFTDARDIAKHSDGGARLISLSPRLTLTGANSDQWLAPKPGSEGPIALALAAVLYRGGARTGGDDAAVGRLLSGVDSKALAAEAGLDPEEFDALAKKLQKAKAAVALPPGVAATTSGGTSAAAAVLVLNALLGANGRAMQIPSSDTAGAPDTLQAVKELIARMQSGDVDVLVIHDANPIYSLPPSAGFAEALKKVGLVVSTATLPDETSVEADWVLPQSTSFESWGDAEPRPGLRSVVQPTLRPIHDTKSLGDIFLDTGRAVGAHVASKIPGGSFREVVETAFSDSDFRSVLAVGGDFSAAPPAAVSVGAGVSQIQTGPPTLAGDGDFTLVAYPHPYQGDGSGSDLPWAQETPDPVTKLSWSSWVEMSLGTAAELGVTFGDVVAVETPSGKIELSVMPRGGIRDDVIAIPIGGGHTQSHYGSLSGEGSVGVARGANVISILPDAVGEGGGRAWLSSRARVSRTGRFARLALSQWTDNQYERGFAQKVSLAALLQDDEKHHGEEHLAEGGEAHEGGHDFALPYDPANDSSPDSPYRWGMTIDTDRCTGCSACVVACSIENNVPVVGEEQAIRHREMTWLRIDRFVGDGEVSGGRERRPFPDRERLGDSDVRHSPMLCQQCGSAPCESVCPPIATYHSDEGINGMIYNRCIGTRYCANNCTYDVRRFNYFDYSRENWPGELPFMLNPDVTVRGQGVMEKCMFCVQRINGARQTAKNEGRLIADGEVVTACQQSCPSQAISFGNTKDKKSEVVVKADDDARSYIALHVLNTRPAVTYLAAVGRDEDGRSHG